MSTFLNISTDTTLGGNSPSDLAVSSQKAVKAYVDSQTGTAPAFANITGQPTDNTNLATALNGKQDTLVSGTNIKTVNNTSLLGSGNISVGTVTSVNNVSPVNGNVVLNIPYGESTSAADAVQKEVTISEITSLNAGQIIIVKPTITSTVANATLKLNNFTAYPILYGEAAITTSTDSITWAANYPSWFRFDGSHWVFLGHGVDNNTTYSAMSVSEGTTGTATSARSMRADYLSQIIRGTKLTGLSTSTSSAVAATDTVLVGMGKLQAEVNNAIMKSATAQQTIALSSGTGTTALGVTSKSTSSYISFSGTGGWIGSYGVSSDKKPVFYNGTGYTLAYTSDIPTTTSSVTSGSTAVLTSGGAYTALQGYQTTANLVTSVSSSSTDSQYPSAKLFYDTVGNIESAINTIRGV